MKVLYFLHGFLISFLVLIMTRCKIKVNLGSTHIWRIYHGTNAILVCDSE